MCYFITLCVPANSQKCLMEEFGRGFALSLSVNNSIRQQLPASFEMWLLTSGMCACDLYVRPRDESPELRAEELREKYRKRGWPLPKIERVISQAAVKPKVGQPEFVGLRKDIAAKLAAVARQIGPAALIVHWYSGDVESEKFAISVGGHFPSETFHAACDQLLPDSLAWVDREWEGSISKQSLRSLRLTSRGRHGRWC